MNLKAITKTEQYYLGGLLIEGESIALRITVHGDDQPIWIGAGNRKPFKLINAKELEKTIITNDAEFWDLNGMNDEDEHKKQITLARAWFDNYLHPEQQVDLVKKECWYHDTYDAPTDYEIVKLYKKYL